MYIMQLYILHFIPVDFQGSVNYKIIKKKLKKKDTWFSEKVCKIVIYKYKLVTQAVRQL